MPDLTAELEELVNSFAEANRPTIRTLLTNDPSAAAVLTSQKTVYDAFIGGDPVKIAAAQAAASTTTQQQPSSQQTQQTQPVQQPANQINLGLDQIGQLLDERVKKVYTSPEFTAAVDSLAEKKAKVMFESERANVIGRSAEISDTITSIRESHLREFNEPLDSAAFKEFYAKEGPGHANDLQKTYEAFVSEKRTAKKIADGIKTGLEAAATAATPGTTVPTVNNPMAPNFVEFNQKVISPAGSVTPAADADKAAQAFAQMRSGWTQ